MTTRADLQQLYDECTRSDPGRVYYRDDCVGDLVTVLCDFLAGDDPTVEVACLKATLADVKAEREAAQENARTAWAVHSEHTDRTGVIIAAHVRDAVDRAQHQARAEAAEATVQLVRGMAESWATQPTDYDEDTEQQIEDGRAILRALDGGEQHG